MVAIWVLGLFSSLLQIIKISVITINSYTGTLGSRGTGTDCYWTLPFKLESKQMEIDDGFNYFGTRSEKKASGFLSPYSVLCFGVILCIGYDAVGINFSSFCKSWGKEIMQCQALPLCGGQHLTT